MPSARHKKRLSTERRKRSKSTSGGPAPLAPISDQHSRSTTTLPGTSPILLSASLVAPDPPKPQSLSVPGDFFASASLSSSPTRKAHKQLRRKISYSQLAINAHSILLGGPDSENNSPFETSSGSPGQNSPASHGETEASPEYSHLLIIYQNLAELRKAENLVSRPPILPDTIRLYQKIKKRYDKMQIFFDFETFDSDEPLTLFPLIQIQSQTIMLMKDNFELFVDKVVCLKFKDCISKYCCLILGMFLFPTRFCEPRVLHQG